MPTSPVSGGAQVPKPQLVKYLIQRGLTQDEAQRVADTVDSGSSPVQFKDGQIVTDGSGVSVSLSDGSLSKEELAAMGFTPQNEADEALIHGWAQSGSDGYQAEGTAEAESIEAEDLSQMFADVQEYANTYEIEFDKALSIYLGENVNLSRQSMAEVKANRQACVQEHGPSLQIVLDGAVDRDAAVLDWAIQTFDIPEGDPVLQNLTSYLTSHEQTSSQEIIKQLLLYAFASKFSVNIQTTVLGLSTPITRPYQGNYNATSLVAWYKNEQSAAPAAPAAAAVSAAPAEGTAPAASAPAAAQPSAASAQPAATQVAQAPVAVPTSQDVDGGLDYQPSPAEQEIYAQIFADLAADDAPPPPVPTQVAQAPATPEVHPGGTLTDASTYEVDGYNPDEPYDVDAFNAMIADLNAGNIPGTHPVTPAGSAPQSELSAVEELITQARTHLTNNEIAEAIVDYQQAMGLNEGEQSSVLIAQNLLTLRNLIIDKLVNDAQAIANDPSKATEAIALYQQAYDLLPEGHPRRNDILLAMPSAPVQAPQPPVMAEAAPPAAPPAEPYQFTDDLVAGDLLANLDHPQRPILSTIIHDRQPVQAPPAIEVEVPAPNPTPVTVVADNNGNNGGVVYGTPAFAPVPQPAPAPEPEVAVVEPEPQPAPTPEPAPAPAPAIVAAAPAVVEPPAAPPPPADPLIVNQDYINAGTLLSQNRSFDSILDALGNIDGDFTTVTQLVWDIRSKLASAADFLHQIYGLPEGDALKGFYGLINNGLMALGQAMQTQDTREDDLAALAEVDRLNDLYQEYQGKCDSAEYKYHHNDLTGAIAIYAELAARPDCPDFISARHTTLMAEAGAAEQVAATAAQHLAEAKAGAIAEYDKLSAFTQEHPELVGAGVGAALEASLAAINASGATLSQISLQYGRLSKARQYVEARLAINSSTTSGAAQGEPQGVILHSNMITGDAILNPNDGCVFPTTGNSNQLTARWNLIVAKILVRVGPFEGRIQLQINPATGQLRLLLHGNDGSENVKEALMIPNPAFHTNSHYAAVEGQAGWFNVEYVDNNPVAQ